MKKYGKFILLGIALLLIATFIYFDLAEYLTLQSIKDQKDKLLSYYETQPFLTVTAYMGVYILMAALSLPGAALLTLLGGALFGLIHGTIVVSFASTIGATLAFLASRFILRDWVQGKFSKQLKKINQGVETEGAFYLFTLRLVPAIPFFIINLVMGLTPMKTITFFFVSQVGMLAGTAVYVNAGTELSKIESLKGILSPSLLLSFCILGIFPIVAKKLLQFFKSKSEA